jgi:hypothetical protein
MSTKARIQRIEDYLEISNLQGRYNHYLQTGQLREKTPELFALDHPDVKAEMADSGLWEGRDGVLQLFQRLGGKYSIEGSLMLHMLMTPVIEVDEDGARARGMWNSLGANTVIGDDGELQAIWQAGKYDIVFCRVDGRWRYLDFRWYVIFRTPYEEGWVRRPIVEGLYEPGGPPVGEFYTPYDPHAEVNHFMPFPPEPEISKWGASE